MKGSSSSYSSRSSSTPPSLATVMAEPQDTSERRHSRVSNLIINEGRCQPLTPCGHLRLARQEEEGADNAVGGHQAGARRDGCRPGHRPKVVVRDYIREEIERHRRVLEEIAAHRHGREEVDIIVLNDSDKETPVQTAPVRNGNPGQGCSKDGAEDDDAKEGDGGDDDGDGDGD
ncbi:putative WRKY transcription factor 35 [Hordeum vulgare]|nr:putative WRKY transcription factor 35 [Hordeum vulgare]